MVRDLFGSAIQTTMHRLQFLEPHPVLLNHHAYGPRLRSGYYQFLVAANSGMAVHGIHSRGGSPTHRVILSLLWYRIPYIPPLQSAEICDICAYSIALGVRRPLQERASQEESLFVRSLLINPYQSTKIVI